VFDPVRGAGDLGPHGVAVECIEQAQVPAAMGAELDELARGEFAHLVPVHQCPAFFRRWCHAQLGLTGLQPGEDLEVGPAFGAFDQRRPSVGCRRRRAPRAEFIQPVQRRRRFAAALLHPFEQAQQATGPEIARASDQIADEEDRGGCARPAQDRPGVFMVVVPAVIEGDGAAGSVAVDPAREPVAQRDEAKVALQYGQMQGQRFRRDQHAGLFRIVARVVARQHPVIHQHRQVACARAENTGRQDAGGRVAAAPGQRAQRPPERGVARRRRHAQGVPLSARPRARVPGCPDARAAPACGLGPGSVVEASRPASQSACSRRVTPSRAAIIAT